MEVEGETVAEALRSLDRLFPGVGERVFQGDGTLRRFVNVFVNDEDIRFLNGLDTSLKEGDELSIVPAMAGGSFISCF